MNIKIIFWGAGKTAIKFITNHPMFMDYVHVIGFTDTDSDKWGTFLNQYYVEDPFTILQKDYDYIIILSIYLDEIRDTLIKTYSISPKQILSVDDAYEFFFKCRYGTEGENKFGFPSLLAGLSYSENSYKRFLKEMNDFFSYLHLKEKYLPYIQGINPQAYKTAPTYEAPKFNTPIWVCWLQGVENAPDIVKCCINSIRKNAEGILHIITYENYFYYVDMEKDIIRKHESGLISNTHFSDILRLALLYKHGGIWIDATVLLMKFGLPEYVYKLPLFMYKVGTTIDENYNDPRKFSSWLISAQKGNALIGMTYELINYYWTKEVTYPYFLLHYFIRMIWNKYDDTDKNKLILYSCNCYLLDNMSNKTYDEALWNMLEQEQPIQKLSYKHNFVIGQTFYNHICEIYLHIQ